MLGGLQVLCTSSVRFACNQVFSKRLQYSSTKSRQKKRRDVRAEQTQERLRLTLGAVVSSKPWRTTARPVDWTTDGRRRTVAFFCTVFTVESLRTHLTHQHTTHSIQTF